MRGAAVLAALAAGLLGARRGRPDHPKVVIQRPPGSVAARPSVVVNRSADPPKVVLQHAEPDEAAPAEEPKITEVFQLQYVSINFDSGRPRSPFNTDADKCLTSLAPDEIGGAGLGYGHCSHYGKTDNRGRPRTSIEKPTNETLFYFFADGRVRNVRTGWCIRRTKCHGHYVYDLGGCDSPLVSKFNLWQARANRADLREFVGLPPVGVEGPCTQCGPYLMKQVCGQEGTSCGRSDHAGWTRHQVHIVPKHEDESYTLAFAPSPFSLCGTRMQQTGEGTGIGEPDPVPPWYYFHRYSPDGTIKKRKPQGTT